MPDNAPAPGTASDDGRAAAAPTVSYVRLATGPDGASTLERARLAGFDASSLGGEAAAMWMKRAPGTPAEVWFTVLPVGWVGEWHESPGPQWVTALSGRWWIETADGARIEMGPGEIHWGADVGTRDRRGHRSGQSGDQPCVQLMVRYADGSTPEGRALADLA